MNKSNRILTIVIALTMIIIIFTGCTKKGAENNPNAANGGNVSGNTESNGTNEDTSGPNNGSGTTNVNTNVVTNDTPAVDESTGLSVSEYGVQVYKGTDVTIYLNQFYRSSSAEVVTTKNKENNGQFYLYVASTKTNYTVACEYLAVNTVDSMLSSNTQISGNSGYAVFYWYTSPDEKERMAIEKFEVNIKVSDSNGWSQSTDIINLYDAIRLLSGYESLNGKESGNQPEAVASTPAPVQTNNNDAKNNDSKDASTDSGNDKTPGTTTGATVTPDALKGAK